MLNIKLNNNERKSMSREGTVFSGAFVVAGMSFLLISLIGLIVWLSIDATGVLKGIGLEKYNWSMYSAAGGSDKMALVSKISMASMGLIVLSFILRIIWTFRMNTASRTFIYITMTIYIVAQGLGFGILFTTWRAQELLLIFFTAGTMFGAMAYAGYKAKDLSSMRPFIVVGTIAVMIISVVTMILYFSGIYSSVLMFVFTILVGILTLAYTMYDVWLLRKYSDQQGLQYDDDSRFRITMFFGFRLLTDLVQMIWIISRLVGIFGRG